MYAAAAGKSTLGIPKKVGEEFTEAGPAGGSYGKLPQKKKPGAKMQKAFDTGRISKGAMAKAGY